MGSQRLECRRLLLYDKRYPRRQLSRPWVVAFQEVWAVTATLSTLGEAATNRWASAELRTFAPEGDVWCEGRAGARLSILIGTTITEFQRKSSRLKERQIRRGFHNE